MVTFHFPLTGRASTAPGMNIVATKLNLSDMVLTETINISDPLNGMSALGELVEVGESLGDLHKRMTKMLHAVDAAGIQSTIVVEEGEWTGPDDDDYWTTKNHLQGTRVTRPGDAHYPESFTPLLDRLYTPHEWTLVEFIQEPKPASRRKLIVIDDLLAGIQVDLGLDFLQSHNGLPESIEANVLSRVVDPEREPWFAQNMWEPLSFHLGEGEKTVLTQVRSLDTGVVSTIAAPAAKPDTGSSDRMAFGNAMNTLSSPFFRR